ncbi:Photosystem Q(B) protein [Platanthera guangdongensis]|uniref:Photosystem Q(B) protein n=1 Tax=Platanthera guangdongensis TaxID=2320717 RepID=A0ABR2LQC6_9ASPA
MRPWIVVAYSAPVAAATTVILIYPYPRIVFLMVCLSFRKIWYFQLHDCLPGRTNHSYAPISHVRRTWCIRRLPVLCMEV